MPIRTAVPADIPHILALERAPAASAFVGQWSEERHRTILASPDAGYFVSEDGSGDLAAYAILRGLSEPSRSIELKRIVIATPERGLGRKILTQLIRMAFDEFHAHRLFLDVFEDNARARHLYESLGFVYEGTMREAAQREGVWCNLFLMSILDREYIRSSSPGE